MTKFDPFGWFERIIPTLWLHRIIRIFGVIIVSFFLVLRVRQYQNYFFKPLWAAETLLFIVLIIAFLMRQNPVARSYGIKEIIIPLIGSLLPFGLLGTCPDIRITGNTTLLTAIFLWMTIATLLTIWGMWVLRHSFSITVEVRALVTCKPYCWVRHPVYMGEILAAAAVLVWRWSWLNCAIFLLFVIIQLLRSRLEESKLKKMFPAYKELLAKSRWLWNI